MKARSELHALQCEFLKEGTVAEGVTYAGPEQSAAAAQRPTERT